ncbi:MAG: hypothetical protein NUW37_00915 [Planctomycetes bacterium]|nr:hypothetical protein [Planctomycetota bacterium]
MPNAIPAVVCRYLAQSIGIAIKTPSELMTTEDIVKGLGGEDRAKLVATRATKHLRDAVTDALFSCLVCFVEEAFQILAEGKFYTPPRFTLELRGATLYGYFVKHPLSDKQQRTILRQALRHIPKLMDAEELPLKTIEVRIEDFEKDSADEKKCRMELIAMVANALDVKNHDYVVRSLVDSGLLTRALSHYFVQRVRTDKILSASLPLAGKDLLARFGAALEEGMDETIAHLESAKQQDALKGSQRLRKIASDLSEHAAGSGELDGSERFLRVIDGAVAEGLADPRALADKYRKGAEILIDVLTNKIDPDVGLRRALGQIASLERSAPDEETPPEVEEDDGPMVSEDDFEDEPGVEPEVEKGPAPTKYRADAPAKPAAKAQEPEAEDYKDELSDEAIETIAERLESDSPVKRRAAIEKLASLGSEAAITALLFHLPGESEVDLSKAILLHARNSQIARDAIVESAVQSKADEIAIEALELRDVEVTEALSEIFVELAETLEPAVALALLDFVDQNECDPADSLRIAEVLRTSDEGDVKRKASALWASLMADDDPIIILSEFESEDDPGVRRLFCDALCKKLTPAMTGVLGSALIRSEDEERLREIIRSLVEAGESSKGVFEVLIGHELSSVRRAAYQALSRFGGDDVTRLLVARLPEEQNAKAVETLASCILKMDSEGGLLRIVKAAHNHEAREKIIESITKPENEKTIYSLGKLILQVTDEETRTAIIESLRQPEPIFSSALLASISHPSPGVRLEILAALAPYPCQDSLDALQARYYRETDEKVLLRLRKIIANWGKSLGINVDHFISGLENESTPLDDDDEGFDGFSNAHAQPLDFAPLDDESDSPSTAPILKEPRVERSVQLQGSAAGIVASSLGKSAGGSHDPYGDLDEFALEEEAEKKKSKKLKKKFPKAPEKPATKGLSKKLAKAGKDEGSSKRNKVKTRTDLQKASSGEAERPAQEDEYIRKVVSLSDEFAPLRIASDPALDTVANFLHDIPDIDDEPFGVSEPVPNSSNGPAEDIEIESESKADDSKVDDWDEEYYEDNQEGDVEFGRAGFMDPPPAEPIPAPSPTGNASSKSSSRIKIKCPSCATLHSAEKSDTPTKRKFTCEGCGKTLTLMI